jgi:hypothetical protein
MKCGTPECGGRVMVDLQIIDNEIKCVIGCFRCGTKIDIPDLNTETLLKGIQDKMDSMELPI